MIDYMHLNTIKPKAYDGQPDTSVVAKRKAKASSAAFGLFTVDGLDSVVYSLAQAKREAKDLRGMGFEVRCIKADTEDALYQLEEMTRGKSHGMPTKAMQAKVSGTVVKL